MGWAGDGNTFNEAVAAEAAAAAASTLRCPSLHLQICMEDLLLQMKRRAHRSDTQPHVTWPHMAAEPDTSTSVCVRESV